MQKQKKPAQHQKPRSRSHVHEIKRQKSGDLHRLASMGSRLTLHSTGSNPENSRQSRGDVSRSSETQNSGQQTKKKFAKVGPPQRDNSLQIQLSNNHIFQKQQQRLYDQLVDDPNEVLDSLPAIRVPVDNSTSVVSPVMTATLPRRSPSNQIIMNFPDLEPQTLNRRSRRTSSASSPPVMGQHHQRSSCRLGRSCSRHSLCRSQNHLATNVEEETLSEKREQPGFSKKINEHPTFTGVVKEANFKKVVPNSNMSIVIFGENENTTGPVSWKSSVVLTNPPQEMLSAVQDEFGYQRGIRTPDFVYMRVHPACGRKYIVPVEKSGKTRLLEMKHILKQETVAGDFGIFQNCNNMYYAFVRVRPPLEETFVVTSGDLCKEVAVFNGKSWEVVRTGRKDLDK